MATRRIPKSKRGARRVARSPVAAQADPAAANPPLLPKSDPNRPPFVPEVLSRTVIAIPLLHDLEREKQPGGTPVPHKIIIDLNLNFPGGTAGAREYVGSKIDKILQLTSMRMSAGDGIRQKTHASDGSGGTGVGQYVFAQLGGDAIRRLVQDDGDDNEPDKKQVLGGAAPMRAIYHVWPDFPVRRLTNKSIMTVKGDAARTSFSAHGQGIVWAVLDSGIDAGHPHFARNANLVLQPPLQAFDFTGENIVDRDPNGHGTHVAGIIAGESASRANGKPDKKARPIRAAVRKRDENGGAVFAPEELEYISGMAPRCKLVNMRVLDGDGNGEVSSIITALAKIQELNGNGRFLLIHGVNLSLGNNFEPEWFACGQSPLCVEVDRLVKSGVVVVVAAGNAGYGTLATKFAGSLQMGMQLTINDPGNAAKAITVGSTHRDMPHTYGVSYFSSKGPTGDGRLKPDLVAPGEKIISCAAGNARAEMAQGGMQGCDYIEDSGTSMAAPHVSGVIAAFLSVRREFISNPDRVKQIFISTATDLGRERYFQGSGLVDLMRAIQSV